MILHFYRGQTWDISIENSSIIWYDDSALIASDKGMSKVLNKKLESELDNIRESWLVSNN